MIKQHLKDHVVAYVALFFAISGSAAAVNGIDFRAQDGDVHALHGTAIKVGEEEVLLRGGGIKLVGRCTRNGGVVSIDGAGDRVLTAYSVSEQLDKVKRSSSEPIKIGQSPPADRGDFNAFYNEPPRGSLDGSFLAYGGDHGGPCTFEGSAISG